MKLDRREPDFCIYIARFHGQRAFPDGCCVSIAVEQPITERDLLKGEKVARIKFNGTLQVTRGFFPMPLTALDVTLQSENPRMVRKTLAGNFEFGQCPIVIEVSVIKIFCTCEMGLTRFRTKARRVLNCNSS